MSNSNSASPISRRVFDSRKVACFRTIWPEDEDGAVLVEVKLDNGTEGTASIDPNTVIDLETLELQTGWEWPDPDEFFACMDCLKGLGGQQTPKTPAPVIDPNRYFSQVSTTRRRVFQPPLVAADIEWNTHLRMGPDNRLWRYVSGSYLPDGEDHVRTQATRLLDDRYSAYRVNEVVKFLTDRERGDRFSVEPDAKLINCRNGLVDWSTRQGLPHRSDVVSTIQIPVAYRPRADCPGIDQFIRSVFPSDSIEFAYEFLGYMLYPGNPYRKAFLLLGPGSNGKSVFLKVLVRLLGLRNCGSIPLQDFEENRFALAQLFGKLANVCGDIDGKSLKSSGRFKQITGGDPVQAEHKGKDSFNFQPYAKLVFSANEVPWSSDNSPGYFDRWLIIPFIHRFEPGVDDDPQIAHRILTDTELSGLLNAALGGLRRLVARGGFDVPTSIKEQNDQYRERSDTVRGFVLDQCALEPGERINRTLLYQAYSDWAKAQGRNPVAATKFYSGVVRNFPRIEDHRPNLVGVRLTGSGTEETRF
jgi:putative DNA primase/helicase